MSTYVQRFIEVKCDNKWIPLMHNGKLISRCSNLTDIRGKLPENGFPSDVSSEIKSEIESEEYKFHIGHITSSRLYELYENSEQEMLNYVQSFYSSTDKNPEELTDREILIDLFNTIHTPFGQIYSDWSGEFYQFSNLIGEIDSLSEVFTENYNSDDVRIIYYFC